MQVVSREDIEDGQGPLKWREVSEFVKIYPPPLTKTSEAIGSRRSFGDNITTADSLQVEVNAKGKRIVYVENALTGELTPVLLDNPVGLNYDDIDNADFNDDDEDNSEIDPLIQADRLNRKPQLFKLNFPQAVSLYLRIISLFVQGLLAGFSFTTLYLQNAVGYLHIIALYYTIPSHYITLYSLFITSVL
jgi:hypothetical protein